MANIGIGFLVCLFEDFIDLFESQLQSKIRRESAGSLSNGSTGQAGPECRQISHGV